MAKIVNAYLPDLEYITIIKSVPICTVDIVIFNRNLTKVLLFKRLNKPMQKIFFTPGGRLFKNETLEDCAIRQAKTELGISIQKTEIIQAGIVNEIFEDSAFEGVNYHTLNCFYRYILDENTILTLDSQHSTFKWFEIGDVSLHDFVKYRIEKCLKL